MKSRFSVKFVCTVSPVVINTESVLNCCSKECGLNSRSEKMMQYEIITH